MDFEKFLQEKAAQLGVTVVKNDDGNFHCKYKSRYAILSLSAMLMLHPHEAYESKEFVFDDCFADGSYTGHYAKVVVPKLTEEDIKGQITAFLLYIKHQGDLIKEAFGDSS